MEGWTTTIQQEFNYLCYVISLHRDPQPQYCATGNVDGTNMYIHVPPLLSLLYKVLTSSTMRGVVSKFKCVTPLVVDTVGYNLKLDTWPERQNTAVSQVWITMWRSHQRGMQGGMDMDRWAEGRKLHLIHPRRAGETEIDSSKMHKHPMIMHDGLNFIWCYSSSIFINHFRFIINQLWPENMWKKTWTIMRHEGRRLLAKTGTALPLLVTAMTSDASAAPSDTGPE